MHKDEMLESINKDEPRLLKIAQEMWENPELGLQEKKSVQMLVEEFRKENFNIRSNIGGMPTSFIASYGEGHPQIGILGEYDALPDLSQKVKSTREPTEEGGPGHGCGHNLFGTASMGAAIGVKNFLQKANKPGTVKFYGCPAEETLVGKSYMAREGVFDTLDAALTWHPDSLTRPRMGATNALNSLQFTFEGSSAHAAAAPISGRSALDAVELMNTGVEYMREHISDDARVHYVITNGGSAPNVVPAEATVWYYIRSPKREMVESHTSWLRDIADAAAKMTQTNVRERFLTGCYNYKPNRTITDTIWKNIKSAGTIDYNESDRSFAAKLKKTISAEQIESELGNVPENIYGNIRDKSLYSEPIRPFDENDQSHGSTEVGDVSWITPTGELRVAAWPVGVPAHTWQAVAANGDFAQKCISYAAKVLAGTAYDLIEEKDIIHLASDEFKNKIGENEYETPLPESADPPYDITKSI